MDAVALDRQVGGIGFKPQGFEQVFDPLAEASGEVRFESLVNLAPELVLVRDATLNCEERAVDALHRVPAQKFLAELDLVDVFTIVPFGKFSHANPP